MDLSPNDIRKYHFPNQMRGYDRAEVDSFREQMAQAFEALKQENVRLGMEVESLKSQLTALKQFEDTIKSAAIDARRNADMTLANAKKEAEQLLSKARSQAEEIKKSHAAQSQHYEAQIAKLELARKSYVNKLRSLISNHLELVNEIANAEPKEVKDEQHIEVTESSEVKQVRRETVATPPSKQPVIKTEEANAAEQIVKVAATPAVKPPVPQSDDLTESLRKVVREEQEPFGDSTVGPRHAQPVQESQPLQESRPLDMASEEIGGDSDDIVTDGDGDDDLLTSQNDSPIDPELAAALENYQHAKARQHADAAARKAAAGDVPPPGLVTETDKRAEDIPNGFVPVREAEETIIDQAQRDPSAPMDPNDLARELDSVVEKFNEEMDKAAKS